MFGNSAEACAKQQRVGDVPRLESSPLLRPQTACRDRLIPQPVAVPSQLLDLILIQPQTEELDHPLHMFHMKRGTPGALRTGAGRSARPLLLLGARRIQRQDHKTPRRLTLRV